MSLKLRILRSLTRLFIILVSLTMSLFSEKVRISDICICDLMPNLIKESWKDSILHVPLCVSVGLDSIDELKVPLLNLFTSVVRQSWKGFFVLAGRGASWGGHSNSIFWPKVVSSVINGIKKNEQKALALKRKRFCFWLAS